MYENHRIYGPYLCEDFRYRLCLIRPDGSKTTLSYPKYLMEIHLGRYLEEDEVVHHVDENPMNNVISNLELRRNAEHARMHSSKHEVEEFICPHCSRVFVLMGRKLNDHRHNRLKGKFGPFCNRSCAGKYHVAWNSPPRHYGKNKPT